MTGEWDSRSTRAWRRGLTAALLVVPLGAGCGQEREPESEARSEPGAEGGDEGAEVAQPASPVFLLDAWARPATVLEGDTVPTNSAAYMVIRTEAPDTVVGVSSPAAHTVELHESVMAGGVMTMRPVPAVPLGPAAPVVLEPGGLHVMLFGLHRSLEPGDSIAIVVRFSSGIEARVNAPVRHTPPGG